MYCIVKECILAGVDLIWMQDGVIDEQSAAEAISVGIEVVMDNCIMREHRAWANFPSDGLGK